MYTIDALPLLIDLDVKPYAQSSDVEFVDTVAAQKNIVSAAMALPFSLCDPKKVAAKFSLAVPSPLAKVCANSFSVPDLKDEGFCFPWGELSTIDKSQSLKVESTVNNVSHGLAMPWGKLVAIEELRSFSYESAKKSQNIANVIGINSYLNILTRVMDAPQFTVDVYAVRESEYDLRQRDLFTSLSALIDFDESSYIPSANVAWGDYKLSRKAAVPLATMIATSAYQPPAKSDLTKLPWGEGVSLYYSPELPYLVEPEIITPGETPEANKKEVYLILNNVSVLALPGNEPLAFADIKIDLDLDSYSWKLSADVLNQQSIDLIKPDASGNKEVSIEINGHRWLFFVPAWSRSRSISGDSLNKRYSITGYSRSQYLGLPYAPKRTRSIGDTTAVQAATDELMGTGFTLDWDVAQLPDWVMPNSVFSYQEMAALPVIKKLATAAGAVVQPAMATDELTVSPRYKVAPWDLAGAVVDRVIHENQILNEGGVLVSNTKINAVFVSGESEGVGLDVTRLGTAGDLLGPDVVDGWLSAVEANTSRSRAEIAASGDRINHALELAIPESSAQPGLLLPGMTVEVQFNDASKNYRGYVQNNAVSVPGRGLAKCRQSVTIEQPVGWEA